MPDYGLDTLSREDLLGPAKTPAPVAATPAAPQAPAVDYGLGAMSTQDLLGGPVDPTAEAEKAAALFEASFKDPTEEVKRRNLSKSIEKLTGIFTPASVMDVKDSERAFRRQEADHATRASPRTSAFLSIQENADVAMQDAKTMAQIEKIVDNVWGPSRDALEEMNRHTGLPPVGVAVKGVLGSIGGLMDTIPGMRTAGSAVASIPGGLAQLPALASDVLVRPVTGPIAAALGAEDPFAKFSRVYSGAAKQSLDFAAALDSAKPDTYAGEVLKDAWRSVVQSVSLMIPGAGLARLSQGAQIAGLPTVAMPAAEKAAAYAQSLRMTAPMGLQSMGQKYAELQGKESPQQAALHALEHGVFEVAGEVPFLNKFLAVSKGATENIARAALKATLPDMAGELGTTLGQNFAEWSNLDVNKGKTWSEFLDEQPEALLHTALVSLVASGMHVGMGKAADMSQRKRADQLQGALTSIFEQAKQFQMDPVTAETFLNKLTDDAKVFVNADELQNVLAQNNLELDSLPPSIAEQLALPSVTGDVEVSIGELMTTFAGTPGANQIAQHVRENQSGLSAAEWADVPAAEAALLRTAETIAAKQEQTAKTRSEIKVIEDELTKELEALPPLREKPFKPHELRAQARVIASMYGALADMAGMSPAEARAMTRPNILGPDGAAPPRAATVTLGAPSTISWKSGKYTFAETRTYEHRADDGRVSRTTVDEDGNTKKEWLIVKKDGAEVWSDGDQLRKDDDYANVTPQRAQEIANEDLPAGATGETTGNGTLTQGFSHGNAMLNVGLDVGATDRAQKIDAAFVEAELNKMGVTVLSGENVDGEYELNGQMVKELTYVPHLSRPLTEAEVNQLAVATGQEAIPQYDNGTGNLWGPKAADWGAFNPEFFKDQKGTKLSDAQKELAQKKTPAKKKATAKPIKDAAALAEAASIANAGKIAATGKFDYIRDLKEQLQNAVRAAAQGADLSATTPEVRKYLADLGTQEALAALQTNSNAVGWYDEKTRQALSVVALVHPEILTDPDARFTFIYALAVTSNGQRVLKNFELAERAYVEWKATGGTMPSEVGAGGPAGKKVHEALARYNDLVAKFGSPAAVEKFMLTEFTAKELAAAGFDAGGENVDTVVLGAALLGPKIGNGFFANLYGVFDRLTMDRWLMRTWGRWTGTLLKDNQAAVNDEKKVLKALVRAVRADKEANAAMRQVFAMSVKGEVDKALLTAKASPWEALAKSGNLEHISDQLKLKSTYPPLRKVLQSSELLDQLRKSGNRLAGKLDGSNEAPGGGNQRNWIRAVFNDILQNVVESTGQKMEMADLQALLWYPEKRLYDSAKSDDELGGYEDDEAPDYANAAVALARSKGVSDDAISAALARPADRPAVVRSMAGAAVAGELGSFDDEAAGIDGQESRSELAQLTRNLGAVAGPVVGIHYSQQPRTSLASSAFGSGMPGAERERLAAATDPRIKQRVAFYVNTGSGITPESGVGPHAHEATLRNLYDADADALKIWRNSKGDMNAAESAVLDAGFDGYLTRNFGGTGAVVMLGSRRVDVQGIKKEDVSARAEIPPSAEIPKMKQAAMAIVNNRALPFGRQSVESWKRDIERSDPDTAALIKWDEIPAGDYYKDQIAGQLWQPGTVLRDAVVYSKDLRGDGRGFTDFFTEASAGNRAPDKPYVPLLDISGEAEFSEAYVKHRGNFDDHIASSIPGFREVQQAVGGALVRAYPEGAKLLDIGASEGAFIKAVSEVSGGKIETVGVDPNLKMAEHFATSSTVPGSTYSATALGSQAEEGQVAWEEEGGTIRYFKPDGKFDVIHEAMVFQFISNGRNAQFARTKEMLQPGGLALFEEKIFEEKDSPARAEFDANEAQKDAYKAKFFTPEALEAKRLEVLAKGEAAVADNAAKSEQKAVGMNDLMATSAELEAALKRNFKHVVQYWSSGNFKGYAASDNPETVQNFLDQLQDLNSEFSTIATPAVVPDGLVFAEAAGPRRGSFNPLTFDLRLLADANRSTFIHEASHFFMAAYIDMASQPDAPPALKQYVEDLLGYLFKNVPGGEQVGGEGLGQKVGAGETALLAPNGKPSKLNAQQWKQVRTPEFKAWFGDWEKHARAKNPVGSLWSDDSVSKIVDENGEPMVVYHGTQQGGFDIFRPEKGDKHRSPMLFATDDPGTARSYSGRPGEIEVQDQQALDRWEELRSQAAYDEKKLTKAERAELRKLDDLFNHENGGEMESQRGIYHLFLNIKNPNETDFEGANWDGERYGMFTIEDNAGDQYYAPDGRSVFTGDEADDILAQPGNEQFYSTEAHSTGETTNSVAEEALRFKQDGAIIRNVTDDGGKHGYGVDPSDVFVFFDSNQVKSATQNTGAFSRTDDSILRQDGQPTTPGAIPEGRTNLERWNAMTLDQQRAYWEFFAEGWEQYAMSGKAPTKALQSAFSAFAKWMKEIYKTLKNFVTMHGTKPLDAELAQYFDRMLATDEELDAARAERGFQALFKNLAESGMSPGQFADYMALDDLQKVEAEELLRSRSLRDMKWLSNAKTKAMKELQAEADELRALVQASVEEELASTPIRQAERWLRKGEMVQDGEQIKAAAGHRLDTTILKAMFPEGAIAGQIDFAKLGRGSNALASSTGTQHPDDVAAIFGFRNGEDLVRQLIEMQPFKEEVQQLTDLRMLEEHGDLASPQAIAKAADEAIHNEAHLKMVATEVWALGNRTGSVAMLTRAAKAFAAQLVDNTVVKKLSPSQYANAATRAGKAAVRALAKKEVDKAANEKRTEMVNAAAAKAAYAAEAEVRAIVNRLRKISAYSDKHSATTSREFGVVQAVRAILSDFGIGQHGEKATKYLNTLSEYDPVLGAVLDDVINKLAPEVKPWDQLKVADLRELHAAINGLWAVARDVRSVELAGEKMSLDDARAQLIAKLEETQKTKAPSKAFSLTKAEERNQDFMSFAAKAIRPESWISTKDGLDSYGPWRRLIWNTIDRAQLAYNADKTEKLKQLKALLEPIAADMVDVKIDAPELGGTFGAGRTIGYSELLHAILHTGNLSNKTKLLLGRGWGSLNDDGTLNSANWDTFMSRMFAEGRVTKAHMDFVQATWDLLESMKKGAQDAHKATTGRYFEEIEATPLVTPYGTYRGGYAPAIVDHQLVAEADLRKMQNAAETEVIHSFEKPAGGFTKSRVAGYNQPLELNIAALGRHIDQVLLFSHMSIPVRNVQRVLKGKDLSSALVEQDRAALGSVLAPWLHSAATQTVTEKGKLSYESLSLFTKARSRAGAAIMFANVSNSVQQLTGFFPATLKVSKKELLFAAAKGWYKPRELAASAAEMSPYMQQRLANEVHAMAEEIDHILLNPTRFEKAQDWAIAHSYFLQMAVDTAMSPIIWQAKFNEETARGAAQQEAVDLADAAVRMTQGTNRAIDIAAMEKGSPFYRMFMQFAGYFNTQANLVGEKLAAEALLPKTPAKYGRIGVILAMGWWAPAIATALIVQLFRGGVDDDDQDGEWLDDWLVSTFIGSPIRYAVAAIPVFGTTINAAVNSFNNKPYDDRISVSPAVSLVEGGFRGAQAAYGAIEDPTKAGRAIRDLGTFLSLFTGVPVTPATRAAGFATDVETGKVSPTSGADYARGIITGVASPESKR